MSQIIDSVSEDERRSFYRRELPCLKSVLNQIQLSVQDIIVIDGFVVLDDEDSPGLGSYLYEFLGARVPVIGVAKSNFALVDKSKREVRRGKSERPLYNTSKGIDVDIAAEKILSMHADHRIPTILKLVDSRCREQ